MAKTLPQIFFMGGEEKTRLNQKLNEPNCQGVFPIGEVRGAAAALMGRSCGVPQGFFPVKVKRYRLSTQILALETCTEPFDCGQWGAVADRMGAGREGNGKFK
jgi:hypothetical protein